MLCFKRMLAFLLCLALLSSFAVATVSAEDTTPVGVSFTQNEWKKFYNIPIPRQDDNGNAMYDYGDEIVYDMEVYCPFGVEYDGDFAQIFFNPGINTGVNDGVSIAGDVWIKSKAYMETPNQIHSDYIARTVSATVELPDDTNAPMKMAMEADGMRMSMMTVYNFITGNKPFILYSMVVRNITKGITLFSVSGEDFFNESMVPYLFTQAAGDPQPAYANPVGVMEETIKALPAVEMMTIINYGAVASAKAMFDALSEENQALVVNVAQLTAAIEAMDAVATEYESNYEGAIGIKFSQTEWKKFANIPIPQYTDGVKNYDYGDEIYYEIECMVEEGTEYIGDLYNIFFLPGLVPGEHEGDFIGDINSKVIVNMENFINAETEYREAPYYACRVVSGSCVLPDESDARMGLAITTGGMRLQLMIMYNMISGNKDFNLYSFTVYNETQGVELLSWTAEDFWAVENYPYFFTSAAGDPQPIYDIVAPVVEQIDALPDPETVTAVDEALEQAVASARAAYEALGETDRILVSNQRHLTQLEAKIDNFKQLIVAQADAEAVISKITALPAEITLEHEAAVSEAKAAYDALSDLAKDLVPEANKTKLDSAAAKITDAKAVNAVVALIDVILTEPTADAVTAARTAYDALTDTQKTLISADTLKKLTDAEAALVPDVFYGDINDDGNINASDALMALQHSVKLITLTGNAFTAADVDESSEINATDALYILQYSVNLIDTLPVK